MSEKENPGKGKEVWENIKKIHEEKSKERKQNKRFIKQSYPRGVDETQPVIYESMEEKEIPDELISKN